MVIISNIQPNIFAVNINKGDLRDHKVLEVNFHFNRLPVYVKIECPT